MSHGVKDVQSVKPILFNALMVLKKDSSRDPGGGIISRTAKITLDAIWEDAKMTGRNLQEGK
jgi:hypothetical protein